MKLSAVFSTVYSQDNTRLRVSAGPGNTANCYPPLKKEGSAQATRAEVPATWAPYDNGTYYANLPVALLEQYIREHGGELPARAQQLVVTPVANQTKKPGSGYPAQMMAASLNLGSKLSVQAA